MNKHISARINKKNRSIYQQSTEFKVIFQLINQRFGYREEGKTKEKKKKKKTGI